MQESSSYNPYWWRSDEPHKDIFSQLKVLDSDQRYRQDDNLRNMRLYGNYDMIGLMAHQYSKIDNNYNTTNRITLNVIQSMIDTVVSKITKERPKVTFLTDEGDWSLQQKAKKLTKFIYGQFYSTKYYDISTLAFLDACIFGTGCIKIYKDEEEQSIKCERIFIDEIKVQDSESLYGAPRQLFQRKYIHRDVLLEQFADSEEKQNAIRSVGKDFGNYEYNRNTDMIPVVEAWHLRSGPNAKDGKHVISIDNCDLFEEEYNKDYFPFVFIRWGVRPLGFFGQGLSEQLAGIQLEINKILKTIQVSMHLTSIPKVFVEASSKVVKAHLDNKIGGIVTYVGTKPSYESVSAIPQDLFMHLDRLYNRAFEIAGISQLSAQSSKPSGLDSGRALREFSDIESERFQAVGQRYQNSFLEAAKIYIDLAKELYESDKKLSVRIKGDKFIETINWSEVDLDEDQYMMHMYPTSSLSSSPSGRLADIQDLLKAGIIDPTMGRELLNFPDLQGYERRVNAPIENIERIIERMIVKGEYTTPEPYQNLALGMTMMQESYLMYQNMNAPDERLDLLRRWMEDAKSLLDKAQQASAPQDPNLVPGATQGVPTPAPTSELMPNT